MAEVSFPNNMYVYVGRFIFTLSLHFHNFDNTSRSCIVGTNFIYWHHLTGPPAREKKAPEKASLHSKWYIICIPQIGELHNFTNQYFPEISWDLMGFACQDISPMG